MFRVPFSFIPLEVGLGFHCITTSERKKRKKQTQHKQQQGSHSLLSLEAKCCLGIKPVRNCNNQGTELASPCIHPRSDCILEYLEV